MSSPSLTSQGTLALSSEMKSVHSTLPHTSHGYTPHLCLSLPCTLFQVLYLPPNAGYKVCKPIKSGRLNVAPSQTLSCVLSQLEDLWTRAIEEYLDLPRKEFKVIVMVIFSLLGKFVYYRYRRALTLSPPPSPPSLSYTLLEKRRKNAR